MLDATSGVNLSAATSQSALVLAKGFPPTDGGVEQYSYQVAREYARAEFDVTVLTQTDGERGWQKHSVDDPGPRVWNVGRGSQPVAFAKFLVRALTLRRSSYSFVHATTWRMGIVALTVFRRLPLVLTVHGREVLNYPRLLRMPMQRVLANASIVIAVSGASQEAARQALGRRSARGEWVVRHNGVSWTTDETALPREVPSGRPLRILSLSRLVPRKNVAASLEAVSRLSAEGVHVEYRVAGRGPELENLVEQTEQLALSSQVTFLGFIPDEEVCRQYQWADIFLHPHTHTGDGDDFEGFGIVIADAMAFGCVPVVGDVGGPRELVNDGDDGLLVDGHDIDAIAQAIKRLDSDRGLIGLMGARARRTAKEGFRWDVHVRPALELRDAQREDRAR